MDYEHDNEFGQRADMRRRDPSMRDGMQYGQRGDKQGRPSPPGTRRLAPGRGGSSQTYRREDERGARGGAENTERVVMPPGVTGRVYPPQPQNGRVRAARQETAAGLDQGSVRASAAGRSQGARAAVAGGEARAQRGMPGAGGRRAGTTPPPGENVRGKVAQAKIQKAKQKKFRRRVITMIIAECFALLFIFTYGYFARRLTMIQREEFDPQEVGNNEISLDTIKKMKGYRMIAVFGVDSRDSNVGAGCQSDVIIICCINEDTGEIKLASVYRDTYLNINDEGSYRKINAAYTNGGPQQALKALNKNLDLNITEYITFSWKAVAEGINILGGVDVEITKSEFKFINGFITETVKATNIGSHQLKGPGMQHLDGVQAVAYGRLRLMDTDYARTERQRKIIELAFAKAKQADYSVLNNILVVVLPNVSTNITFADMTTMALGITKYHIGETAGFPFAKGNVNIPKKGDCVIPQTLESNVKQLHTFLFGDEDYETTEQVKQISSKIAADSGMYKEGTPFKGSALSTDGYVPDETTKAAVKEKETTAEANEDDDNEDDLSLPWETDSNGNIIGFQPGETDENGDLIDAPIDDWPEEEPGYPNANNPGINRPVQPGETNGPGGTGNGTPGGNGLGPGGANGPDGPASQQPGTGNGDGTGPGTSVDPGGNSNTPVTPGGNGDGAVTPGGNGVISPGNSGTSDPRGGNDAATEVGPGMNIPDNNNQGPAGPVGANANEGSEIQEPGQR